MKKIRLSGSVIPFTIKKSTEQRLDVEQIDDKSSANGFFYASGLYPFNVGHKGYTVQICWLCVILPDTIRLSLWLIRKNKMYADVIKSMDGARTIKEHITKLQDILDASPTDPQLVSFLQAAITSLMQDQYVVTKAGKASQKVRLNQTTDMKYKHLYNYCQQHATTGTPQWQVAASNAGWTPPTTP